MADKDFIQSKIDNKKVFAGYHMNKKNWITICLDNSLDDVYTKSLINKSFELANKK